MPLSVLMAVYRKDNPLYLEQAIQSVIKQTYPPDEIVIIIDGPISDDLRKVIRKQERNFQGTFVTSQNAANLGLAQSMNVGLRLATHEIVARMDSDDISLPDRFAKQIAVMSAAPDITLVGGWYLQFDSAMTTPEIDRRVPERMEEITRFARRRTPFNHVTAMFRKTDVLEVGGYNPQAGEFEDWWLALSLIKHGFTLYNIQDYLVHVRGGSDFYRRRGSTRYLRQELGVLLDMQKNGLLRMQDVLLTLLPRLVTRLTPPSLRPMLYAVIRSQSALL